MHKASTVADSGEGQKYAALPMHVERLFLCFEPVTSRLKWRNLYS